MKLSGAARRALRKEEVSPAFWTSFFADFPHLEVKSIMETSVSRAKMCNRETALLHTTRLRDCLIKRGIYSADDNCIKPGKDKNVIWLDEMGQFFNYLLLRGQRRKHVGVSDFVVCL